MAAIGRALGDLSDSAARQRVLRWAQERFASEAQPSAIAAAQPLPQHDADLEVDGLNDMFAADARQDDDDSLSLEEEPRRLVVETEKQPLEAVLRTFAAEFQRFADEWNGAAA